MKNNTREIINKNILKYFNENFKKTDFIPGKSKIHYAKRIFDHKEITNLVNASLDFWLTYGPYSLKFEKKLAEFLNIKYAFLVNSGSSANLLAFMTLTSPLLKEKAIKRKDEIITVAAGFPTTIAPIIQYGAIPVFVDIEIKTANIDVSLLENALSPRTKAVMLAHTLGNVFNVETVKKFCKNHKLWLIEDNCDALGSRYKNKYTGTFGDIGTSSFYPPHHMTLGEGGALYTNNTLLKKIILSMRDWGRDCWCQSGKDDTCKKRFSQQFGKLPYGYDHKYVYSHFGYNLKATDLQAAIGLEQLKKLPGFIKKRKNNFNYFSTKLAKYNKYFILPKALPDSEPSWFGFFIIVKPEAPFGRHQIVQYLENKKIQTRSLFGGNLIKHPCFNNLKKGKDYKIGSNLKNTDLVMNNGFWFGVYPGLTADERKYIISQIDNFITNIQKK